MKNQVKQLGYVCLVGLVLSTCGTSSEAAPGAASASVAIQVLPGGAKACFYEDINYGGNSFCSDSGSSLLNVQWNDRISSVRLAQGVQVQLFADRDYQGKMLMLRANTPTLVRFGLNDLASSYKISAIGTTSPVNPSKGCDFQVWKPNTNYRMGTIVLFPPNGQYYKVINTLNGGTDMTIPVVSTYFWAPTTCETAPPVNPLPVNPPPVNPPPVVPPPVNPPPVNPPPVSAPKGCDFQVWKTNTNYRMGTIVLYPPNGQYYKVINTLNGGTDMTIPVISTYFWAPTTCETAPPVNSLPVNPPPVNSRPVNPPPVALPPVVPPPVNPPTSDFDKKCTPTVTLKIEDQARKNLFLDVAGSNPEAFIQEIGRKVCGTLYQKASEIRDASHITLIIRDDPNTLTYRSGNGNNIEVMISTAHLKNVKNAGRDVGKEIKGVLFQEMTHMYQQDDSDKGGVDGGLIQGIADAVRFRNGYIPDGAQPAKKGHWNDDYRTTAFFLLWVDQQYSGFMYRLNLSMDNRDGKKWTPAAFQSITGKTVDQLWSDYIQSR